MNQFRNPSTENIAVPLRLFIDIIYILDILCRYSVDAFYQWVDFTSTGKYKLAPTQGGEKH